MCFCIALHTVSCQCRSVGDRYRLASHKHRGEFRISVMMLNVKPKSLHITLKISQVSITWFHSELFQTKTRTQHSPNTFKFIFKTFTERHTRRLNLKVVWMCSNVSLLVSILFKAFPSPTLQFVISKKCLSPVGKPPQQFQFNKAKYTTLRQNASLSDNNCANTRMRKMQSSR